MKEAWETALAVVAALGGGSVIVLALSNWLGRVWADRLMASKLHEFDRQLESLKSNLQQETEHYKGRLRKSEFVFQREYQAASALVELIATIEPSYSSPWMDHEELCEALMGELDSIEDKIGAFTAKHGAILPDVVRKLIVESQNYAGQGKFGDVAGNDDARTLAGKCHGALSQAETLLIKRIQMQSATN